MRKLLLCFLSASAILAADSVTATVVDVGPSPLSNGTYYIGPYTLDINGTDYAALCINAAVSSYLGISYQATIAPLNTVALLEDAWLYEQITGPGVTDAQREDLQYAAWGINTAGAVADEDLAAANYGSVNPAEFDLVTPVDVDAAQPFIVDAVPTPEPSDKWLMPLGLGFLLVFLGKIRPTSTV